MKQQLLFLFLFSALTLAGLAQSLELSNTSGVIAPNAIIIQVGTPDSGMLFTHLNVKNKGNAGMNVLCKKTQLTMLDSTLMMLCWAGQCYPSEVNISPSSQFIDAGQTYSEFSGDYIAQTMSSYFHPGESVVRWTFYNEAAVNDSVTVTVKYTTFYAGIEEDNARQSSLSNAYPNPAGNNATFSWSVPQGSAGVIIVRNVLGSTILSEQITSANGKFNLNSSGLSDGVYFYSLMVDGKLSQTKKLIVKH